MIFGLCSDRKFENIIKNTPDEVGPGHYEITSSFGQSQKSKAPFGSKSKRQVYKIPTDQPPPPGEYNPKLPNSSITVHSVFVSGSQRNPYPNTCSPSPASYSPGNQPIIPARPIHPHRLPTNRPMTCYVGQDVTGYTTNDVGEWLPIKKKQKPPNALGPGTYNPTEPLSRSYGYGLKGSGPRPDIFSSNRSISPGPATYLPQLKPSRQAPRLTSKSSLVSRSLGVNNSNNSKPTSSNSTNLFNHVSDTPGPILGPTPWVSPEPEGSVGFKSRSERTIFPSTTTPSPVSYYHAARVPTRSDSLPRGPRNVFAGDVSLAPGPDSYTLPNSWIKKGPQNVNIRRASDSNELPTNSPGPGSYETSVSDFDERKTATSVFASRTVRDAKPFFGNRDSDDPGPGSYNPKFNDDSHRVPTQIHESRFSANGGWVDEEKASYPGPASYQEVVVAPGKGVMISNIGRTQAKVKDVSPGPGHYNVVHNSLLPRSYNSAVNYPQ